MTQLADHPVQPQHNGLEIAVIGMSGRFPGAPTVEQFWRNVRDGKESIYFFSNEELMAEGIRTDHLENPKFVKAKGLLENIEWFDASYFGYTPRDAEIMDPQQRIFLECAVEALENAGYHSDAHKGLIGVFAGSGMNAYLLKNLFPNPELVESVGEFETIIGNDKDFLTTRVSYKLNLEGPSVTVQTACSTSLVAVCMACQSLLSGECDLVLAGGVSIYLPQRSGYFYQEGGILSPDGHCRAFDADAKGTAFSGAAGIVVLKRLEDALHDRDCIHAVIKGAAINNDGSFKIGFTAPRVDGQAKAIKAAQIMAEIDPSTISYVEAHGTGTPLGDPIEVAALTQVFSAQTEKKGYCAIGSVKTNIGHADAAAGIVSLIKTVLMLEQKEIPPSLHFKSPNPKIDFANSPFYVNTKLTPWIVNGYPRRAGVSSFGIGGTNAHVVLEEAPRIDATKPSRPWQLILLSAKSPAALNSMTAELAEHLKRHADINMDDVAYTLQVGRKLFPYRRMLVCRGREDAIAALDNSNEKRTVDNFQEHVKRNTVFMFSGQGAQYVDMGAALYCDEPVFREQIDRCTRILEPLLGLDLRTILYPDKDNHDTASQQLIQTSIAQVSLFVIEYSLAQLWMAWGVTPSAMVGHSIGEYVAACLADVFSLEDALSIVVARGRIMQRMPNGSMLAVALSERDIKPLLREGMSLAAVNGPALCVVSAEKEAIGSLMQTFSEKRIPCRLLHTSHAFHSHMMTPMMAEFTREVERLRLSAPRIPYISNVTGNWIKAEEATDPSYWARHLRQTVRFADAIRKLNENEDSVFLEIGPGNTLKTFVKQCLGKSANQRVFTSLRHPKEQKSDTMVLLDSIGRLWTTDIQPDWFSFHADRRRRRVPLPSYPFERKRYWVDPVDTPKVKDTPLKRISDPTQWLYIPFWEKEEKHRIAIPDQEKAYSRWLFFMDQKGLGNNLLQILKKDDNEASIVFPGKRFFQTDNNEFEINPRNQEDYIELFRNLKSKNSYPDVVVHLWSFDDDKQQNDAEYFEYMQTLGYYSLIYLCKALQSQGPSEPITIQVIANGVSKVLESDELIPEKATILGPCKVIPQECSNITCRFIDVGVGKSLESSTETLARHLLPGIMYESPDPFIAYRDGQRWIPKFNKLSEVRDPSRLAVKPSEQVKRNGVYLITGGLGNVGMVLAEYLAGTTQVKLILTGRSEFPNQEDWKDWINANGESDCISRKIEKLSALKEKGAELLVVKADVSDEDEMRAVFDKIYRNYGELNGVIHAAGIVDKADFRYINELGDEASKKHFLPKVYGLYVLQKLLTEKRLDFCHVVSSVASILGGLGYSAYTAANIFMDTFVLKNHKSESIPWKSVNWDAWRFDEEKIKGMGASIVEQGIKPKDGHAVFNSLLCQVDQPQVIVSTTDLEKRIKQWINLEAIHGSPAKAGRRASFTPARIAAKANAKPPITDLMVEQSITAIWQKLLGIDRIDTDDDFFELGGSSLLALRLFTEIENTFEKKISLATLINASTVGQLSNIVKQGANRSGWNSLVKFHDNGSGPPLFLIHGAEGNILLYRELAHHLGPTRTVYGIQSQGLDGKKTELTRIEEIAAYYINEILTVQSEGPYYIGGYCMGGVVAFEMAQQLLNQGKQVNLLAMFETYNPRLDVSPTSLFQKFYYKTQNVSFHLQNFLNLKMKDKFRFLSKKTMVEFGRFKETTTTSLSKIASSLKLDERKRHSASSIKQINDQAYYNYKPQPYSSRLTLFKPRKFFSGADDYHFGWKEIATGGIDVVELPVNPRGMLVEPYVKELAEKLNFCIIKSKENGKCLNN